MKQILMFLILFFTTVAQAQTVTPSVNDEFCPNVDITFTVTFPGTKPSVVAGENSPVVVLNAYNITTSSGSTTFNFVGKFRDVNVKQVFDLKCTNSSNRDTTLPLSFKNIQSLFYANSSSCPSMQPNPSSITAPMCQTSNIPISFTAIKWSTFGESPSYCFGTITTYEYQLPAGWVLNGTVSTGSNWITGSNSVSITSDASNGGFILIRPANSCGINMQNGQTPVVIPISRPAGFSVTQDVASLQCGSSTPVTFTINNLNNVQGITDYTWNLGPVTNGWLLPNGTLAPQTYSTGITKTLTLTPDCGKALQNISATVTVNGIACNATASTLVITEPSLSITGSSYICGASSTYQINNLPCNTSVSWSSSNTNIATVPPDGNPVTVTKWGNGDVTITANVTNGCFQASLTKLISVGLLDNTQLSVYSPSSSVRLNVPLPFVATYPNRCNLLDAEWDVSPSNAYITYNTGYPCRNENNTGVAISFLNTGTYYVKTRVQNVCGWSSWSQAIPIEVTYNRVPSFTVAPNPAASTITVQRKEKSKAMIREVRILDNSGNLKKQYKYSGVTQAQLNVADLKEGIYFVEITSTENQERQMLLIQR